MVAVSNVAFVTDLVLRRKKETGGKLFLVDEPYSVTLILDGRPQRITVLPPFSTDLASIPKIVPRWIAEKMDAIEAAVVHDYLYRTAIYSRAVADAIFFAIMEAMGTPGWKKWLMFLGVRAGGAFSYQG